MLRARSITAAKSTSTRGIRMPHSDARRACAARRDEAIIALLGVQPQFTQEPPRCSRSTKATDRPAPARARASGTPACPAPMMAVSTSIRVIAHLGCSGT
jgi:hypothetical protein